MRAPTIPSKEFLELAGNVKESASDGEFSWDELKNRRTYHEVLDYLQTTNVKYISEGSSRVSFYLPTAIDKSGKEINAPCCLKVAFNDYGIGQNKSDVKAFQKFGSKFDCFPRLYSYDEKNFFYFLCELATPALNSEYQETIDSKKYFEGLEKLVRHLNIEKEKPEQLGTSFKKMTEINTFLDELYEAYELVFQNYAKRTDISDDDVKIYKKKWIVYWTKIKNLMSKYSGIADVSIGFIKKSFYDSDIDHADNWGYVKRKENLVLLPIDFGLGENKCE